MKLETIILVGQATGTYSNKDIRKEFEGKLLVSARPNGAVIVHNLGAGVRPICYIAEGADLSISKNVEGAKIELYATTEDGQELNIKFSEVIAMQGVPVNKTPEASLSINILKCVFDLGGRYGRATIAQILTGSVAKKILTINMEKLGSYGIARDTPITDVFTIIDCLIEESYLAYAEDSEFPILVITSKGLDILAEGEEIQMEDK